MMAETNQFMSKFFADNPVAPETIKHFESMPWTNKFLSDEAYKPIPTFSRVLKPTGEDYFFSRTVSTPITIPYYLTLQTRNFKTPSDSRATQPTQSNVLNHKQVTVVPEKPDCIFLLSLGEKGIDGHPNVTHGGMTCAILDETMGLMIMLHHQKVAGSGPRDLLFTANLNVSYRAPVLTPGEIIVRTWMTSRTGRKWYSKGQIVDKTGKVLVEADGLWLVAPSEGKL